MEKETNWIDDSTLERMVKDYSASKVKNKKCNSKTEKQARKSLLTSNSKYPVTIMKFIILGYKGCIQKH